MAIRVRVISKLHQGYHRAGLAIAPGESELAVSAEQLAALAADPRLVVVRLAEDELDDPDPAPDAPAAARALDSDLDGVAAKPAKGRSK